MKSSIKLKSLCIQISDLLEPEGGAIEVSKPERQETLKACADAQWVLAIQIAALVRK